MKHIISIAILAFNFSLFGAEIDSFTPRYLKLQDATDLLNKETKTLLQKAVEQANSKGNCSEARLSLEIWNIMWDHQGELRRFLSEEGPLDTFKNEIDESVYRQLNAQESIVLGGLSRFDNRLGTVIKIGEYLIGSDKFEHFFGFGYGYYMLHNYGKTSVPKLLTLNTASDRYIFGGTSTGVISFADKTANFAGFRFYQNLTGKKADFIDGTFNSKPIIECIEDNYVLHGDRFDWTKFIDASWDESYNCSYFRRETMKKKIDREIELLEQNTGLHYQCPMDPKALDHAKLYWGKLSRDLINDKGHQSIRN